jgi:hypothetical protein
VSLKSVIWVVAFDEAEATQWAAERRLPSGEWRYAHGEDELKLAVKGDRFSYVGRYQQRPDFFLMAGVVRAKKMDWWRS